MTDSRFPNHDKKTSIALVRVVPTNDRNLSAFAMFRLLTLTETAIGRFKILRKQYPRIGRNDLRIASIAMEAQMTLVTRNRVDFKPIEGLTIVNWSR